MTTIATTTTPACSLYASATQVGSSTVAAHGGTIFASGLDLSVRVYDVSARVSQTTKAEFRCRCLNGCSVTPYCIAAVLYSNSTTHSCYGLRDPDVVQEVSDDKDTESWTVAPSTTTTAVPTCTRTAVATLVGTTTVAAPGGLEFSSGHDLSVRVLHRFASPNSISQGDFRCQCLNACSQTLQCHGAVVWFSGANYTCYGVSEPGDVKMTDDDKDTESWTVVPPTTPAPPTTTTTPGTTTTTQSTMPHLSIRGYVQNARTAGRLGGLTVILNPNNITTTSRVF
jgi:hypothetical protein